MRELGRGLEYAEVLIRSHLCPLTMGPPAAVKSIGLVGYELSPRRPTGRYDACSDEGSARGIEVFAKAGAKMEKGASCG